MLARLEEVEETIVVQNHTTKLFDDRCHALRPVRVLRESGSRRRNGPCSSSGTRLSDCGAQRDHLRNRAEHAGFSRHCAAIAQRVRSRRNPERTVRSGKRAVSPFPVVK